MGTEEEMTGTLASGTISRRGALKLMGGATLGLLVLPTLPSTASAAGRLQPPSKISSLGTFDGVEYFQYDGLFVGKTSTGKYSVPYQISAPANLRRASRSTVLVEPPHFAQGKYLRESYLGRPFLFGEDRRFLHASVGYSTISHRILDPTAKGVFINGGVVDGSGRTDDEIIVDFARALRSDPARALIGSATRRYLAGFSDSADPVKRGSPRTSSIWYCRSLPAAKTTPRWPSRKANTAARSSASLPSSSGTGAGLSKIAE